LYSRPARAVGQSTFIREQDWDGNLVREWTIPANRPDFAAFHHDVKRIHNKELDENTLIANVYFTYTAEQALADGAYPSKAKNTNVGGIVEFDLDGNIIWEWHQSDHYIQDYDATKNNYVGEGKTIADYPGKFDMNWGGGLTTNFNSNDYNETLDQILVNSATTSEIWILDHAGTFIPGDPEGSRALAASDAGDIIYRWGNPSVYGAGDPPYYEYGSYGNGHMQLFSTHDAQFIKEGLPGAGHFLVFDNNSSRPGGGGWSRLVEINPYDGPMANGVYVWEADAGYGAANLSNLVVWQWHEKLYSGWSRGFYSGHISGVERQPNGNTLGCAGEDGHFVEVTYGDAANGVLPEIVWEYINPDTYTHGIQKWITIEMYNQVYRAHRYAPDYSAFVGRDLTPKGKITDRAGIEAIQDKLQNFLAQ